MKQIWIFVVLAIGAGLGISAAFFHPIHQGVSASTQLAPGADGADPGLMPVTSCVGARRSGITQEFLTDETLAARTLLSERRFTDALPQLREVAVADPGFPGINLDIANALLQTGQPTAARIAANRQIAISECLSKLPPKALSLYCSAEFPHAFGDRCPTQMTYLWHSAQLQSALVDLELAHSTDPHLPESAQLPASQEIAPVRPAIAASHVPSGELAPMRPRHSGAAAPHVAPRKPGEDPSLEDGAGTDQALGAYSKQ